MALSKEQASQARLLRAERPAVIRGTNVIANDAERLSWFARVSAMMRSLSIQTDQVNEFCNIAGVPD